MLSNPFSRPTRTAFLLLIFLLAGMFYYHPASQTPRNFPHIDSQALHQYLNRSDHAQKPFAFMSRLGKQLQHPMCTPDTVVINSTRHHYRTETQTKTLTTTKTQTALIQPTCDGKIDAPFSTKGDAAATPEQLTVAKLRKQGIVIVFKTGAQEVSHLAIQVGTTLRYMSANDILFFSDQQGSLGPFLINDVLRNADQKLKDEHPDFEIYREIKRYQRTGQDILELRDNKKGFDRAGWKLDKYKFLHMVEETFEMRPDAKWYVFIETDSYVFWDNLAEWLKRLDSKKPYYIGSQVSTGGVNFAHGGSGYVLSNAAMNKLLGPDQPQGLAASWDERMKNTPYGDYALAVALKEKGVPLTVGHPLFNGYKPSTFTYGPGNHWCQPVVTMHHVLPAEVSNVWRYERQRELHGMANATLFADLYFHFVEPHLTDFREDWDNLSHGTEYSQKKIDEAKAEVQAKKDQDEKASAYTNWKESKDKAAELLKSENEEQKGVKADQTSKYNVQPVGEDTIDAPNDKIKPAAEVANEKAKDDAKMESGNADQASLTIDQQSKDAKSGNVQEKAKDASKPEEKSKAELEKEDEAASTRDPDIHNSDVKIQEKSRENLEAFLKERNAKKEKEMNLVTSIQEGKFAGHGQGDEGDSESLDPMKEYLKVLSTLSTTVRKRETTKKKDQTEIQKHAHESFEKCGKACEEEAGCFQWVFYSGTCKLGMTFRLGKYMKPSDGKKVVWKSGWIIKRVKKWTEEHVCTKPEWLQL